MVKDLDILCLGSPWDVETLKMIVTTTNPSFYLIPSKTPGATYKVLWYRIGAYYSRRCKIDLLFPGTMNIPSVPVSSIDHPAVEGVVAAGGSPPPGTIPCAPFTLVFLLKLQAWAQHLDSDVLRFRLKANTDASDLKTMLPIARRKGVDIRRREGYLPRSFLASATPRAKRFVGEWPETLRDWRALGFSV